MNAHPTIDKAGRVVISKSLRKDLHLELGDSLEMESSGEQITLRLAGEEDGYRAQHELQTA